MATCLLSHHVEGQITLDSPQLSTQHTPSTEFTGIAIDRTGLTSDIWYLRSSSHHLMTIHSPETSTNIFAAPKVLPTHYGGFCKLELKLEKATKIAPRFRLGSVDYVDKLEGKYR